MPDIHIEREHGLGLAEARKVARRWAESARNKLAMDCAYEEGEAADLLRFSRAGVDGEMQVTATQFLIDARLGLLFRPLKTRIESEIVRRLDLLLN